jgi:SAM-dependent methyltransferase
MLRFYGSDYYEHGLGVCAGSASLPQVRGKEVPWSDRAVAIGDWLSPVVKAGARVLEIGCGSGENLARVRAVTGCEAVGLEPSVKMAAHAAASYDLSIIEGGLNTLAESRDTYACIILSHVLEHFHEPLRALEICHAAIQPGGTLLVEVPNVLNPDRQKRLSSWFRPEHLYYFSEATLRWFLARAGFETIRSETSTWVRVLARRVDGAIHLPRPREVVSVMAAALRHETQYWPRYLLKKIRARA